MRKDNLSGKYLLKCTQPGCHGELIARFNHGERVTVGAIIPLDSTEPTRGRCPVCKRHKMQVVTAPEVAPPPPPKGFTKVPTS